MVLYYDPKLKYDSNHVNDIINELTKLANEYSLIKPKHYLVITDDTVSNLKTDIDDIKECLDNKWYGSNLKLSTNIYSASSVYELLLKLHNEDILNIVSCVYSESYGYGYEYNYYSNKSDWTKIFSDIYQETLNNLCKHNNHYTGYCNGVIELDINIV